jgi:ABC-type Na+ efflux pump permease subunit
MVKIGPERAFTMNKKSLLQNFRIILAITGKDILDAIKNKTTLSVLATSFFLLLFYIFFPILEEEDVIRVYDAGMSAWLPSLEDSIPYRMIVESSQQDMETNLESKGEAHLGLVLPANFDQQVKLANPVNLQGYLLNWVSDERASQIIADATAQIGAVVDTPVTISMERLYMTPETTGTALSHGVGTILVVVMVGMILVPNLMLEEKRTRTFEALLVSPASAGHIAAGKTLAGVFYCLVGFIMASLFNMNLVLQWGLAILAGVGMIAFSVTMGLFLGTWIDNRQQLLILANITIFPMLIAVFLSLEMNFIPTWIVTPARWVPTTVAFDLLRAAFTPQTNLAFIAPRVLDLTLFVIILSGLVSWKIKRSDRK